MNNWKKRLLMTFLAILGGVVVGAIILGAIGKNPLEAYKVILVGALGSPKNVTWTVVQAVPIILTGIGVAFAFNTGLFNIGAEGQYIIGSLGAVIAGIFLPLPPGIHGLVALLIGGLCGAIWGGLVGLIKAKFGVNEVITSIMLNWIGYYFSNWILEFSFLRKPASDNSFNIAKSASIRILGAWKTSGAGRAFLKQNHFLRDILNPPVHWGILVAIIAAIAAWYILHKTTLGYQLKAVGFNKDAAEYGGINIQKNVVRAMAISGFFAGLAGATTVLGVAHNVGVLHAQQGYGFNGIAVALIAANSPLACIPAGLLFSGLNYGGGKLNSMLHTPSEVVKIVIGVIVLFVAMPRFFEILAGFFKGRHPKQKTPVTPSSGQKGEGHA